MFNVVFTQAARAEPIDAQDWYEGEAPGLGHLFRAQIDSTVERMSANPLQFPVVYKTSAAPSCGVFPTCCFSRSTATRCL